MSYNAVVVRYSTLSRIARIAEDQWGLVTRRQAEGAGVSQATLQRLAKTGILDRVAHGVYRLTGAPPPDYLDLRAAWLQLARRFRRGSGHRSRGSYPTVRPRRCTVLATCPQTGTSSRCRSGGNLAGRTSGFTAGRSGPTSGSFFTGYRSRGHRASPPTCWMTRKTPRQSRRLLPMPSGPSMTTQARSRTPLRRTPPVSDSGEGMASRSFAGSSTQLATRMHPGGYRKRECRPNALPGRTGSRQLVPRPDLGVDDRRSFIR